MRHTIRIVEWLIGLCLILSVVFAQAGGQGYRQTSLVSDLRGLARRTDAHLVNPWGVAQNPLSGFVWVADNGSGVATVYLPNGRPAPTSRAPLVVTIPPPTGSAGPATPTGIVFNPTGGFVVGSGAASGPSRFLFATEDGTVSGWNPAVQPTQAVLVIDHSAMGAVYKGLTLASVGSATFLYVANFCGGAIEVYDASFSPVALAGSFTDPGIPAGFAPFDIRNLGGTLYVTYAKQATGLCHDDEAGPGNGFVDAFDPDGTLRQRVASQGSLNSPWGLALAPPEFGRFANTLLVGNFGDGRINAFAAGGFLGQLEDHHGAPITIDGLWTLDFGNDRDSSRLFFAAGIDGESHGLLGTLQPQ